MPPSNAPSASPSPLPTTAIPSPEPSGLPTPYPSPNCVVGSETYSTRFVPDGAAFAGVTASVYLGTWDRGLGEVRDEAANVLLTQLSAPFPDRDYLCVVTNCYTIEFLYNSSAVDDGLAFTIESASDEILVELKTNDEGATYLAFCADGDEFNHAPSASPTLSLAPSSAPSPRPSTTPTFFLPTPAPSGLARESEQNVCLLPRQKRAQP